MIKIPARTDFIEHTLCNQKGQPLVGQVQLVLQFQYALKDFCIQHDDMDE